MPTSKSQAAQSPASAAAQAAEPDRSRVVARLSTTYVLRSLQLAATVHDGDILLTVLAYSIMAANVAHLDNNRVEGSRYETADDIPPDEERRPVSIQALSRSLGLPFETTRRYANRLIAKGWCKRVRGGVIVPSAAVASQANAAAIAANIAHVRTFLRALKRVGVVAD